ncbi:unnamed protein product [Triticum aestivum]|uniref:Uncharacterized protein n=1 Tax=Triticum aestivum TaxID=4565 RepID=A0A7H4LLW9_WHEAT|nr:uncharacterized protein LOC123054298 [Triticum aestivum]XP_044333968.1 uncharacterized protein LOC123054298 [Triticum aestivum]SPT19607.1 unnamed protein product [Triticum aestivum]
MDDSSSQFGSCGATDARYVKDVAQAAAPCPLVHPEGSSSSAKSVDPPAPTSRISIKHAACVIQKFDDYKKWLVEQIGFGGMLKLPAVQKLSLKCSAWIMSRVSVSRREIKLRDNKVLRFFTEDVHKVFGIPCGHRSVKGRDAIINPEAVHFIKTTLQMDKTGVHSLRAAENFLLRDINENSSKLEKDCFQIAFVIFVTGHVLAPTTKHNYATIDYWGAIANTEAIVQFNWCEYVLLQLLDAVKKLKSDMLDNNQSTNLTGCHFFFQIFLLDNLDLGILNKPHNVLPRISDFDPESFRKMLIMAADPVKGATSYSHANLRDASTVCYIRQKFPSSVPSSTTSRRLPRGCATPAIGNLQFTTPLPHCDAGHQVNTDGAMPSAAAPGPLDFAKYLREKYPQLVADEITMIIKQQYARGLMQLTQASNSIQQALLQARNGLQLDMYKFSDQVINSVSTRCVCCRVRGFTGCPASGTTNSKSVRFTTPVAHKI